MVDSAVRGADLTNQNNNSGDERRETQSLVLPVEENNGRQESRQKRRGGQWRLKMQLLHQEEEKDNKARILFAQCVCSLVREKVWIN